MSLTLAFWNIPGNDAAPVAQLAKATNADVILLAECDTRDETIAEALSADSSKPFRRVPGNLAKLRAFTWIGHDGFHAIADFEERATAFRLRSSKGNILLVAVHLPSKLWRTAQTQADYSRRVANHIRTLERKYSTRRTVIIGDFNMNPFDEGMVSHSGFHAVSSAYEVVSRTERTVMNESTRLFYNPTWSHFGDRSFGPPGTYFRNGSDAVEFLWHMTDQVLLSPEMVADLVELRIIESLHQSSLLNATGRPNRNTFSDHLPVTLTLDVNVQSRKRQVRS